MIKLARLGDAAFILRDLGGLPAHRLARALAEADIPGVTDVTASYETVGLYVDPDGFDLSALESLLPKLHIADTAQARHHQVPVCYGHGPDADWVAEQLGLSVSDLVMAHSAGQYTCAAIGFCPGFPYLTGLPPILCGLPRRVVPRKAIPPGSVAIVADQAGIYPLARPGGWHIVGLTPSIIVDVDDGYFPIAPGDTVAFYAVSESEFEGLKGCKL